VRTIKTIRSFFQRIATKKWAFGRFTKLY